jgi:hypothetical protein
MLYGCVRPTGVVHGLLGRPHCLIGLQQVFGEPFHHLLLQQRSIHDES